MEAIEIGRPTAKTTRHTLLLAEDQVTLVEECRVVMTAEIRQELVAFLVRVKGNMESAHQTLMPNGRLTFRYTPTVYNSVPDIKIYNTTRQVASLPLMTAWRLLAELVTYEEMKTEEVGNG